MSWRKRAGARRADSTYKNITSSSGTTTHALATHFFLHLIFLDFLLSSFGDFTLSNPLSLAAPFRLLLVDISKLLQSQNHGLRSSFLVSKADASPSSKARKDTSGAFFIEEVSELEVWWSWRSGWVGRESETSEAMAVVASGTSQSRERISAISRKDPDQRGRRDWGVELI